MKRGGLASIAVVCAVLLVCAAALGWAFVSGGSPEGRESEGPGIELVRDEEASAADDSRADGSRADVASQVGQSLSGSKSADLDDGTPVADGSMIGEGPSAEPPASGVEPSGTTFDPDVPGLGNAVPDNVIPID